MKRSKALCLFLLMTTAALFAQKGGEKEVPVTALKIQPKVDKRLSKSKASPFLLEVSGILKAAKGYKISYVKARGVFLIAPSEGDSTVRPQDGKKDLGGGITLRCVGCGACDVTTISEGSSGANYGCGGACGQGKTCMGFVQVPKKSVAGYQTPEGGNNWMNL